MEETEVILEEEASTLPPEGESPVPDFPDTDVTPEAFDVGAELSLLSSHFPSVLGKGLSELVNEKRYEELRTLGLSPEEAFLATAKKQEVRYDNRTHLRSSVPRNVTAPKSAMTPGELLEARELFGDISDEEIRSLHQRVTRQK